MGNQAIVGLGFAVVGLLPVAARAQDAEPSAGTASVLIREIRLLRQAIEKQSATAARAQLLIGRLALQDQRSARARQSVERLEGELTGAERERDRVQMAARETAESLGRATDDERREQLEKQARMLRARLTELQADISRAQGRLSEARQSLDAEGGRYEELDAWLRDLDRQLEEGH